MRLDAGRLRDFCARVLAYADVPPEPAAIVADALVAADLRGVHSHGAMRLPVYFKRLRTGLVDARAQGRWLVDRPSAALYDAGGGLGHPAGVAAIDKAIEKAKQTGVGVAAVRNSSHFGMAAYYLLRALDRDCIAMVSTNSAPRMAPYGGKRPILGTNPLAIGAPSQLGFPLILDMATSVVAIGKIALAAKEGKSVPADWGLDPQGNPTTDPSAIMAGSVHPMAGPKGSGLSFMLDVLCGALAGAAVGTELKSMFDDSAQERSGHFFLALDVSAISDLATFFQRLRDLADMVRASGSERVYLPGEVEAERQREYIDNGIPFDQAVVDELNALAREAGAHALL